MDGLSEIEEKMMDLKKAIEDSIGCEIDSYKFEYNSKTLTMDVKIQPVKGVARFENKITILPTGAQFESED